MRINSYNKFFTKVAKIMNTDVKDVKSLDNRYKVELTNHVHLNVYKGVCGSLFIHDHRGIAHITSCYDFDDFKTMKDLYERLILDYSETDNTVANDTTPTSETEEATRDTIDTLPPHIYNDTDINPVCMKCQADNLLPYNCNDCNNKKVRKNSFYGMFGGYPTITEMYNDKCFCCPADRKGNECTGKATCGNTWKRYEAIINPEWHHVNLNTLANLDFDMLDEKRQLYLKLYREIRELIQDLHKCKSGRSYERRLAKMYIRNAELLDENKVSHDYIEYVSRKISMCNVECGLWTSKVEEATGLHKSRRYNRHILKY